MEQQKFVLRGTILEHRIFVEKTGSKKKETPGTRVKLIKGSYMEIRGILGLGNSPKERDLSPLEDTIFLFSEDGTRDPCEGISVGKRISITLCFKNISFLADCFQVNQPTYIMVQNVELA